MREVSKKSKRAVVLLSGGLDSSTLAYYVKSIGYDLYAITFDYGQRSRRELNSAEEIGRILGVKEHKFIKINLREIGGSALTDKMEVPKFSRLRMEHSQIPITYVPARNTIFLSISLAYAEVVGADAIFYGANCLDYSGYPDCRPEYIDAFREVARLGTKRGVEGSPIRIETPFLFYDKSQIVKKALELNVPIEKTWSCYEDGEEPCGKCESCLLRKKGIEEAKRSFR
ncbi:MAG: queuosine biosynthesis protein QueC [Candidatus Methanolliviera sp. GoM_asphalt]|nr:MAG: queuosine biosynthesis protein QueC [Candidatus Methanolliviera sp. GoM_asphalt]